MAQDLQVSCRRDREQNCYLSLLDLARLPATHTAWRQLRGQLGMRIGMPCVNPDSVRRDIQRGLVGGVMLDPSLATICGVLCGWCTVATVGDAAQLSMRTVCVGITQSGSQRTQLVRRVRLRRFVLDHVWVHGYVYSDLGIVCRTYAHRDISTILTLLQRCESRQVHDRIRWWHSTTRYTDYLYVRNPDRFIAIPSQHRPSP